MWNSVREAEQAWHEDKEVEAETSPWSLIGLGGV